MRTLPPIEHRVSLKPPRLTSRQVHTLPIEEIQPYIRIAHRSTGVFDIHERVIVDHEFVLLLSGAAEFTTRQGRVPLLEHQLLFIRPFVPHGFASTARCEHLAVHFDLNPRQPKFVHHPERRRPYEIRFADGLDIEGSQRLTPEDGLHASFLQLVRDWSAGTALGRLSAHARLLGIITSLLRPHADVPTVASAAGRHLDRTRIERALALMREHVAEPLTGAELARAAGLGHSRFSIVFKDQTGYTPKEYLRRLRIDRARTLLGDIDLSIKQIAARTGFEDQYHFSRVFRQIDGVPPTAYREALLAGRSSGKSSIRSGTAPLRSSEPRR
ncbi:MAG: helix-turn-helix domain-containing protein [Planctomycetes bacterium]|nr:helix-turn-helix domain-containing protein [Planctomycetota bacterium]